MNEQETIRKAMSILGSRKTAKKSRQSRINGRKHVSKQAKSKSHANGSEIDPPTENKV